MWPRAGFFLLGSVFGGSTTCLLLQLRAKLGANYHQERSEVSGSGDESPAQDTLFIEVSLCYDIYIVLWAMHVALY